jgi:glycerol uptake facilitator-like aquaporin
MSIILSEFIGTFIILISVLTNNNAIYIAAAFLAAITIAASSGANLNPIVTLIMVLKGVIPTALVLQYLIGQVCGGLGAFFVYKQMSSL